MGQHKYNPNTIKAKNGELPPKKKPMSKRKRETILRKQIQDKTGLSSLVRDLGGEYIYV